MNTVLDPLRGDNEGMSYPHLKRWLLQNSAELFHNSTQATPLGELAMAVLEANGKDLVGHTLESERKLRGAVYAYMEEKRK